MKITGTVVYNDFEGGFWGIVTDDGQQYRPINDLPAETRTAGQRVEAEVEPVQMLSFTMWGKNVNVHSIKPL